MDIAIAAKNQFAITVKEKKMSDSAQNELRQEWLKLLYSETDKILEVSNEI